MQFDIAEKKKELSVEDDGVVIHILDVRGEPAMHGGVEVERDGKTVVEGALPVTWTVCGINSEQYARAEAWQTKVFRSLRGREQTAQERRAMHAEFIARCSKGNSGFTENGQPLPFTTENATTILLSLPYIRRQIESTMGSAEAFQSGFTKTASDD